MRGLMEPVTPVCDAVEVPETLYGATQREYKPLPAFRDTSQPTVPVITRWRLSAEDLQRILDGGDIYLTQLTFGYSLQAVSLSTECPIVPSEG
jgi:hypothetical protein